MKFLMAICLTVAFAASASAYTVYAPAQGYYQRTPWFPGKFFTNAPRWQYVQAVPLQPVQPYIWRDVPLVPADQTQQYQQHNQPQ